MKCNIYFLSMFLLANSINVCSKEITGKVFCGKKGLSDVVVTDGVNFTTTDSLGNLVTIELTQTLLYLILYML